MKNKKYLFAVLALVAVLCLSLFGCAPASESAPEKDDLPTISILTIGEIGSDDLKRVSAALSEITVKQLGCRVELRMIREDEYDERIDNLLLESDFADIFVCRNRTTMNKLMDGSYIYRLDRYLNRRPKLRSAVEDEQAWEHVMSRGYTYGIPFGNSNASACGEVRLLPESPFLHGVPVTCIKVRAACLSSSAASAPWTPPLWWWKTGKGM